ncbi:MAG: MCP four helix bundle domain-containing protein, partial [Paucibacter sp.]|nr:MCP four helix bundle domain-containing protein [Roseateles sp.]
MVSFFHRVLFLQGSMRQKNECIEWEEKMMANLKVGARLALAFTAVLALTLILGTMSIFKLSTINDATTDLATNWLPATKALGEYQAAINLVRRDEAQHVMSSTDEQYSQWENKIAENKAKAGAAWSKYAVTITDGQEQTLAKKIVDAEKRYFAAQLDLLKMSRASKGAFDEVKNNYNGESFVAVNGLLEAIQNDIDFQSAGADIAYTQSQNTFRSARVQAIGLLLVAIAVGSALAYGVTRWLTGLLGGEPGDACDVAKRIASGDLTTPVPVRVGDETTLFAALRDMQTSLGSIVGEVRHAVDSIGTGSGQIATGSADLSQRTEEQASNLQQTAASMEQMTAAVQKNA